MKEAKLNPPPRKKKLCSCERKSVFVSVLVKVPLK